MPKKFDYSRIAGFDENGKEREVRAKVLKDEYSYFCKYDALSGITACPGVRPVRLSESCYMPADWIFEGIPSNAAFLQMVAEIKAKRSGSCLVDKNSRIAGFDENGKEREVRAKPFMDEYSYFCKYDALSGITACPGVRPVRLSESCYMPCEEIFKDCDESKKRTRVLR